MGACVLRAAAGAKSTGFAAAVGVAPHAGGSPAFLPVLFSQQHRPQHSQGKQGHGHAARAGLGVAAAHLFLTPAGLCVTSHFSHVAPCASTSPAAAAAATVGW
eukprot:1154636-Pelagomonas_calceolata.AAC.4